MHDLEVFKEINLRSYDEKLLLFQGSTNNNLVLLCNIYHID